MEMGVGRRSMVVRRVKGIEASNFIQSKRLKSRRLPCPSQSSLIPFPSLIPSKDDESENHATPYPNLQNHKSGDECSRRRKNVKTSTGREN